ncbi:MAG: phenylalanine--tRNA ligase subunit beta [Firmicutes bacterium]|nr:phenylalanine--tRNA ligase subunit beta [Bacillota bacterium]
MRVPISWLKEYVDINIPIEELADRLTMVGIAVDKIEQFSPTETVLELELTPNRSDCLGIINVAREVAIITGSELRIPDPGLAPEEMFGDKTASDYTSVEIAAPDLCDRFVARIIENVRIGPSPQWLQARLQAVDIRPINNVVDVTNFVMMESGQPLHAFDYHRLEENRIVVRRAHPGEIFYTLDGVERHLDEDMLVIADARNPVGLAGIMGGLDSEVTEETRTVLLESAHFEKLNNRQTARKVGLRSEATLRFEKGTDIEGAEWASRRAVQLMAKTGAGRPVGGSVDNYINPWFHKDIFLRVTRVNLLLGTALARGEITALLKSLGMDVRVHGDDGLLVSIPSYRQDLEREEDLVEEVARLYGYDKIPTTLPTGAITPGIKNREQRLTDRTRGLLAASGMTEVITFSFTNQNVFDRIGLVEDDPRRRTLMVANPMSEDQRVLRTMLMPNLLEVAVRNLNRRVDDLSIFELGRVFWPKDENGPDRLPWEKTFLAGLCVGGSAANWYSAAQPMDFFYLKGVLEELLNGLGISDYSFQATDKHPSFHPGRTAEVIVAGQTIGVIGEVHPDVQERYELGKKVNLFEIDLGLLYTLIPDARGYRSLPRYPSAQRDLALIVRDQTPAAAVAAKVWELGGELLEKVELFDLYRGKGIPEGARSLAYSLTYQAPDRTLTDSEVNEIQERIIAGLDKELGVKLR